MPPGWKRAAAAALDLLHWCHPGFLITLVNFIIFLSPLISKKRIILGDDKKHSIKFDSKIFVLSTCYYMQNIPYTFWNIKSLFYISIHIHYFIFPIFSWIFMVTNWYFFMLLVLVCMRVKTSIWKLVQNLITLLLICFCLTRLDSR